MNILRYAFALTVAVTITPGILTAQISQGHYPQPVYQVGQISAPVMHFATPAPVASNPFSACSGGCIPGNPTDCNCKNLDCKICLPYNCKKSKQLHAETIPCKTCGLIPQKNYNADCAQKVCDFQYETEVPEVHCVAETCTEIGKRSIECMPGCHFTVCVPVKKCTAKTVECKLAPKSMPMELWKRQQGNQTVYDVYVINDCNPDSNFHAGGMPEKWLIMHCGSAQDITNRFPGAICNDGKPLVVSKKGAKPKATPADVDIKLVMDKDAKEELPADNS